MFDFQGLGFQTLSHNHNLDNTLSNKILLVSNVRPFEIKFLNRLYIAQIPKILGDFCWAFCYLLLVKEPHNYFLV